MTAKTKAVIKFAIQPAKETPIAPSLLGSSLEKLTGTGFAHPKLKRIKDIVPIGSKCFRGLKLNLPSCFAVVSPK